MTRNTKLGFYQPKARVKQIAGHAKRKCGLGFTLGCTHIVAVRLGSRSCELGNVLLMPRPRLRTSHRTKPSAAFPDLHTDLAIRLLSPGDICLPVNCHPH